MSSWVSINGRLLPEGKAGIPVDDSAYLYGLGLFETLRAANGRVLFLKDHLARLKRNARLLGLKLALGPSALTTAIYRTLKKNRLREAHLRINLSQSPEGRSRLTIIAKPYRPYPRSFYTKGGPLILARSIRNDSGPIATVKTTDYLTKIIARKEIAKRNAVDGVLLNVEGNVTEGASSNLFIVKKGRIYSPPLSDGLLPGIRRKIAIKLARKLKIPVAEKSLRPRDLKNADEIFLTSTLKGILPIRSFDGKKIGKSCPGPITWRLMQAYSRLTS
jgi:branched-subunit amino acid aminotransferase/4-amino-4-deoxychorismate lyase